MNILQKIISLHFVYALQYYNLDLLNPFYKDETENIVIYPNYEQVIYHRWKGVVSNMVPVP
jgi:hypothetical protein